MQDAFIARGDELLVLAAKQVNGRQKRIFLAAEVRSALSKMGYTKDLLPSERTLRDILNRMNYRLKRIQKKTVEKDGEHESHF